MNYNCFRSCPVLEQTVAEGKHVEMLTLDVVGSTMQGSSSAKNMIDKRGTLLITGFSEKFSHVECSALLAGKSRTKVHQFSFHKKIALLFEADTANSSAADFQFQFFSG